MMKSKNCYLKMLHNHNYEMSESWKETIVTEIYRIVYGYKERTLYKNVV